MTVLPVLMYHHVNPNKGDMITVTPEVFEAQMRYLKEAGFRTLGLDEVAGFIEGKKRLEGKNVAVTFDDGYLDNYIYAYPALKKHSIKAAVFLVSSWVEGASNASGVTARLIEDFKKKPPLHDESKASAERGEFTKVSISWEMAREMLHSGLVEFHSHTVTHRRCDKLKFDELQKELKGSKEAIEKNLGNPCRYLCWPKGRFNDAAEKAARTLYRGVFGTGHGVAEASTDIYRIKRIVVKDSAQWFASRLKIYSSPILSRLYLKMKGKL